MSDPSARMLALLSLLQVRRDWSGADLSHRLSVSTRTVRRDIDRLRDLGYRVHAGKGPDGGYRLEAGSELPPLLFDDDQAIAIAVALGAAPATGVDIKEAAERARATIRHLMPSRLRHRLEAIEFTPSPAPGPADPAVVEVVSAAVRDRMTLRFGYGEESATSRRVEPHGVVARNSRWYLVAWDLDRDDWRIYRLDRMAPRVPAGPLFESRAIPAGGPGSFVDSRFKGSHDVDEWPCRGTFEVALSASEVAPWVDDGVVESIDDGSCIVSAGSWSWTGLVSYALRFDAPVRFIGPPELRDAAAVVAERLGAGM